MQRLIPGKFLRPQPGPDCIVRPRLCTKLDAGIWRSLTLVSAPAGYGKSTLLSSWTHDCPLPHVWLTLDHNDDELGAFLAYVIGAIRQLFPAACAGTAALLAAQQMPPTAYLSSTFINDLAELPEPFVLILDDYHVITAEAIHQLVAAVLHYCPGQPHLVIATRHDPPLPLARLRAAGALNEIRVADLRFTNAETEAYLVRALPNAHALNAVAPLFERTEGWPAGLRLASLALDGKTDYASFLATVKGSGRFIMAYLLEEVLAGQPRAVEVFLQRTALLDRFCAPLCDAVMAAAPLETASGDGTALQLDISGQVLLEYVAGHNLFVIPLDDQQHWYRYHHLFQELLRHRLNTETSAEQRATLRMAASHWFETHGMLQDAIDQALAIQNLDLVARLIARQRTNLLNQTRWLQIEQCLKYVPYDKRQHDPALLMLAAWAIYHRGNWELLPAALGQVAAAMTQAALDPEEARSLRGEMSTLASLLGLIGLDAAATIANGRQALADTAHELWIVRILARLCLALGLQMAGDLDAAYASMQAGLSEEPAQHSLFRPTALVCSCYLDWIAADLCRMERSASRSLALSQHQQAPGIVGIARLHLGTVHYHHNDLPAAAEQFATVVGQPYLHYGDAYAYCACGLALTYQAQGRPDEARAVSEAAIQQMLETGNSFLLPVVAAFAAELALQQGNLTAASNWAAEHAQHVRPLPMVRFYEPQLTPVKIWLAQATPASYQLAEDLLDRLFALVESTHNTRFMIEVLALQALLAAARGQEAIALQQLERAVRLAQPGGFLRLFVDLGPAMALLLTRLCGTDPQMQTYLDQMRAAFDPAVIQPAFSSQNGSAALLEEPLTSRELDVLACFTERLSDKEIAGRLVISLNTVHTHTKNIFAKLGVHNRRAAALRAVELGLVVSE